ncbi:RidA family protein (plasmid) [Phyllobacterium sp. 628]|uniref:RidA family protein n=1 Tax=Phyllobacterium sp. 628 TaxID=2718938 RepID=UPI0016626995|nr:RidA family protein [Phyllobacterium sp. 628]QND55103.1 RidA family protein [Phyllobacterium sp. 628]
MSGERQVVRDGPFKAIIADGVKTGNMIYLSGQVSVDADGQTVGAGDIAAQVRHVYQNVAAVLEKFGATMADIVDETIFVTDIDGFLVKAEQLFGIRAEIFGQEPQISQTLVQVARLGSPDWLLEIKCVAIVSGE